MKTGNGTTTFRITCAEYVVPLVPFERSRGHWTTRTVRIPRKDLANVWFVRRVEGVDWIRGWKGKRVDAFKAAVALRPVR